MERDINTSYKDKNDSTTELSNCHEYVDEYQSTYVKEELPYISGELVATSYPRCAQADGRVKECIRIEDEKTVMLINLCKFVPGVNLF